MKYSNSKFNHIKVSLIRYCKYKECLTTTEKNFMKNMNKIKAKEYSFSRSFLRYFLSDLFNIILYHKDLSPLKNILLEKHGYVSLSHTVDALAICWSPYKIGIDLERFDRNTISIGIFERLFNKEEKKFFRGLNIQNSNQFLKIWVIKEAISKYADIHILEALKFWQWDIGSYIAKNNKAKIKPEFFNIELKTGN